MGIAVRVADLLKTELSAVGPSRADAPIPDTHAWPSISDTPGYVLDGVEYRARHPIARLGLAKAKL